MQPMMMTQSAGRLTIVPKGEMTGRRTGRGGGRTREQTCRVGGRISDQDGQGGNRGNRANGGVDEVLDFFTVIAQQLQNLLPTIITQVDFKAFIREEFCPNNEIQKLETKFLCHTMVRAGHVGYTDRFHELDRLVTYLVTPKNKRIDRYIYGLASQICRMVAATEPTIIQSIILKFDVLTDEAIRNGSLKKNTEKRLNDREPSRDGNIRDDNKRSRTGRMFAMTTNPVRKEYMGSAPKCTNCNYHHLPETPCRICTNCNHFRYFAKDCMVRPRMVNPSNARSPIAAREAYFKCGGTDHYKAAYPRLNRAPGQGGNCPNQVLAVDGGQGRGNNGNQARRRAFMLGADKAHHDPNIMTGKFTLNNHYATTLFDSGADYSFVSTTFIPLLDIESSNLEIEGHTFDIDLIPSGHGRFDVIVGMDWLFRHKTEIVCHEKVVRIPLLSGKILRVLGERPEEKVRHLMSAKAGEEKLKDIIVVRNFSEVFPDDLSRLPPSREIKLHIDLIPREMSIANFPSRLVPSEMEELSNQLKELQDKGLILDMLEKEKLYAKFSKCEFWLREGGEHERASQTLQDKLCNAPVLALPDGPEDFVVYCDASCQGLGYVLMQRGKNCCEAKRADDGALYYLDRIWAPLTGDVRTFIMDEAHKSKYSVYLGADKIYYDLRDMYWWPEMKKDIALYGELICTPHKVMCTPQKCICGVVPYRIEMDYITKLPRTSSGHDTIWVIVDRLIKFVHFLSMREDCKMDRLDRLYLNEIAKGKLAPRFVGPFEITERIGLVAYRLRLPKELNGIHDTFHVLNLKICLADPTLQIPLDEIQIDAKLNFVKEPVEILKREFKKLKRSRILIVKVRWNSKRGPEFTRECEDQMKLKYPHLFSSSTG
nr:hypothetical protein [Tanacetum cinerariifolium]